MTQPRAPRLSQGARLGLVVLVGLMLGSFAIIPWLVGHDLAPIGRVSGDKAKDPACLADIERALGELYKKTGMAYQVSRLDAEGLARDGLLRVGRMAGDDLVSFDIGIHPDCGVEMFQKRTEGSGRKQRTDTRSFGSTQLSEACTCEER